MTIGGLNLRKHITAQGETFFIIALQYYDDEKFAHHIANANMKYANVLVFDADIDLEIPDIETADDKPPWR